MITGNSWLTIPWMNWKKCLIQQDISASVVHFYVSINSIDQIHDYFGNRLLLNLKPAVDKESIVSREKVTEFKQWMGK